MSFVAINYGGFRERGLGSNYALFGDTKRTSVGRKLSGLDSQGMAKEPKTNPISINVCQAHLPITCFQ